ncbi:MAG: hypothetical protein OJF47_000302 [Nitrospira sp.]|nr:MAG: hypothetical protein OJF47_000302 [Nitrospira sp.]
MEQDQLLALEGHPLPAPGTMLLEVAFVHAPKFNVPASRQMTQFFNAATLTGSDWAMRGLGLRSRNPMRPKIRWY